MKQPLMWMGIGAWVGAMTWYTLPFAPTECLGVLGALVAFSFGIQSRPLGATVALLGGTMLGQAACGLSEDWNAIPTGSIRATVIAEAGPQSALIKVGRRSLRARFTTDHPPINTPFIAIASRTRPRPVLPGAFTSLTGMRKASTYPLQIRDWLPLGETSAETAVQTLALPVQHKGIILALTTGNRSDVPDEVRDLLRRTGTIHLLAISGLHVGLVAGLFGAIIWVISRPLALFQWPWFARILPALASVIAAYSYGHAVGWPVSTQRAFIMVSAGAVASIFARRTPLWNLWGLALLLVVLRRPLGAGNLGLCLSFGAVAGLLAWGPVFSAWIRPHWWIGFRWPLHSISATTAAVLGTLPVSTLVFQELSFVAPVGNILAMPLLAGIAVPAALLSVHLGLTDLVWIADAAIDLCLSLLALIDHPPWVVGVGPWAAAALVLVIPLARFPLMAATLVTGLLFPWAPTPAAMELVFPDVGQGAAALVSWPNGKRWLIDGGGPSRSLRSWLIRKRVHRLDAVFLTHPQKDHMGGLVPILSTMEVGVLWAPRRPRSGERAFHNLWRDAALNGIELKIPTSTNTTLIHPDPVWLAASPRSDNDQSLVLSLQNGEHRFLLMGDIEADAEARLAPLIGSATVVQVPHHGSLSSSTPALVQATQPQWAVVQCGKDNQYGHPHPKVVHRWGPKTLLRTDKRGTIRFISDGIHLQVSAWRPETGWTSID